MLLLFRCILLLQWMEGNSILPSWRYTYTCCDNHIQACEVQSHSICSPVKKIHFKPPIMQYLCPCFAHCFALLMPCCLMLHVFVCAAARLNLPIKWLPDRIAEQNFNLEEPPTKASAWVSALLNNHLKVFRERLSTMPMLSPSDVDQVWLPWNSI